MRARRRISVNRSSGSSVKYPLASRGFGSDARLTGGAVVARHAAFRRPTAATSMPTFLPGLPAVAAMRAGLSSVRLCAISVLSTRQLLRVSSRSTNVQRICSISRRENSGIRRKLQAARNLMVHMFSADRAYRTQRTCRRKSTFRWSIRSTRKSRPCSWARSRSRWRCCCPRGRPHDLVIGVMWVTLVMLIAIARAFDMREIHAHQGRPSRRSNRRRAGSGATSSGAAAFMGMLGVWCLRRLLPHQRCLRRADVDRRQPSPT